MLFRARQAVLQNVKAITVLLQLINSYGNIIFLYKSPKQ